MPNAGAARRDPTPPSFLQSARAYLAVWVDVLHTRLDLFSTELQDEREHIQHLIIGGVICLLCLAFGLLLLTFLVVVAFWETPYRLVVLGGFTVVYIAAGIAAGVLTWRMARQRPKMFTTTLGELSKDYQHLTSQP